MIAITSAKSGMGKTFFAISLAGAFAVLKQKILFFDADLGALNINEQLDLELDNPLAEVLSDTKTLNQIICNSSKPCFDIISNKSGSFKFEEIPQGRQSILLQDLKVIAQNYDKIIIDSGSSYMLFQDISQLIILCNDEPSSIVNCFEIIRNNLQLEIYIVINYTNSSADGQRTFDIIDKACREFLTYAPKFFGIVRKDSRVRDALRNKVSLFARYPQSEAAQDILQIAQRLVKNG